MESAVVQVPSKSDTFLRQSFVFFRLSFDLLHLLRSFNFLLITIKWQSLYFKTIGFSSSSENIKCHSIKKSFAFFFSETNIFFLSFSRLKIFFVAIWKSFMCFFVFGICIFCIFYCYLNFLSLSSLGDASFSSPPTCVLDLNIKVVVVETHSSPMRCDANRVCDLYGFKSPVVPII